MRLCDTITQTLDERDDTLWERDPRIARVAVMLEDPQRRAVAVGAAERGGFVVDLAVGPAVEVDDAVPGVGGVDAVFDDVVEVAG